MCRLCAELPVRQEQNLFITMMVVQYTYFQIGFYLVSSFQNKKYNNNKVHIFNIHEYGIYSLYPARCADAKFMRINLSEFRIIGITLLSKNVSAQK